MEKDEKKAVNIYVGDKSHTVDKDKISYQEVVDLYLNDGGTRSPTNQYLIKFSRGHSDNESGTLQPDKDVMVKDGMRFRVSGTGES